MQMIFLYGPVASGKLTIAQEVVQRSRLALFHNHLVVDAVAAVFPFGSAPFVRLREQFWLGVISEAARHGQSLIFTFAPEPSVAPDFPARVRAAVEAAGGQVVFVALTVPHDEQERRLVAPSREAFGKLRSLDIVGREQRGSPEDSWGFRPAQVFAFARARSGAGENLANSWPC